MCRGPGPSSAKQAGRPPTLGGANDMGGVCRTPQPIGRGGSCGEGGGEGITGGGGPSPAVAMARRTISSAASAPVVWGGGTLGTSCAGGGASTRWGGASTGHTGSGGADRARTQLWMALGAGPFSKTTPPPSPHLWGDLAQQLAESQPPAFSQPRGSPPPSVR